MNKTFIFKVIEFNLFIFKLIIYHLCLKKILNLHVLTFKFKEQLIHLKNIKNKIRFKREIIIIKKHYFFLRRTRAAAFSKFQKLLTFPVSLHLFLPQFIVVNKVSS